MDVLQRFEALFLLFPFQILCKRLWCTSAEGDHKGCRTQHMPMADGTDCERGKVCGRVHRRVSPDLIPEEERKFSLVEGDGQGQGSMLDARC